MGMLSFDAWTTAQLQNAAALLDMASSSGTTTVDDLAQSVAREVARRTSPLNQPPSFPCPQCGYILRISPVNVSRCTRVGGQWKSIIQCDACGYDQLSNKTPAEVLKDQR